MRKDLMWVLQRRHCLLLWRKQRKEPVEVVIKGRRVLPLHRVEKKAEKEGKTD